MTTTQSHVELNLSANPLRAFFVAKLLPERELGISLLRALRPASKFNSSMLG